MARGRCPAVGTRENSRIYDFRFYAFKHLEEFPRLSEEAIRKVRATRER